MRLSIDFVTGDDEGSGTIAEALEVLVGLTVDLEIPDNSGYPAEDVYVVRVDDDGELAVCEIADGVPLIGCTWAIPQHAIRHVRVPLGGAS